MTWKNMPKRLWLSTLSISLWRGSLTEGSCVLKLQFQFRYYTLHAYCNLLFIFICFLTVLNSYGNGTQKEQMFMCLYCTAAILLIQKSQPHPFCTQLAHLSQSSDRKYLHHPDTWGKLLAPHPQVRKMSTHSHHSLLSLYTYKSTLYWASGNPSHQ